jgi:transcription initiation factor IIE alpha subunit
MDRAENWILVGISIKPLTVEQIEQISGMNKLEVRQLLTRWEKDGIIERLKNGDEPVYQFTATWKRNRFPNLKDRLLGRRMPPEIRSKLREALQI